jgi:hypothetical protein
MLFRIALILGAAVLVVLIGGAAYLAFVDIPAPTTKVEKVVPDGRFPQ